MRHGNCNLCGEARDLVHSHIWPRFGYERYVSDLTKGGQFVDFHRGRYTNRQYKEYWFCPACDNEFLGGFEDYAATFCKQVDQAPTQTHAYDGRLLPFLTSISWRVAKHDIHLGRASYGGKLREAMQDWKDQLNLLRVPTPGKRPRYRPHSQHLFIVFAVGVALHRAMGGQVYAGEGMVLSQVGPLYIVGLLDRRRFSRADLKAWEASEISPDGGSITPVSQWHVGRNVSLPFARLLARHERLLKEKAVEMAEEKRERQARRGR